MIDNVPEFIRLPCKERLPTAGKSVSIVPPLLTAPISVTESPQPSPFVRLSVPPLVKPEPAVTTAFSAQVLCRFRV